MIARAASALMALMRLLAAATAHVALHSRRDACWALALLSAAAVAQFSWPHFPADMQGRVWNASQAALCGLLYLMAARRYDWGVRAVAVLGCSWQLLTAGCSIAYLWRPFPGRCTGAFDYPLAMMALSASAGLAWLIYTGGRDGRSHSGSL